MRATINGIGIMPITIPPMIIKVVAIYNTTCPAIMLAASLTERVTGRIRYTNNSIRIIIGARISGIS